MPVPPPTPSVPFDSVNDAMNWARYYSNDTPNGLQGNLLANTQPYAQSAYNAGWRALQRDLAVYSDPANTNEVLIQNIPPVASTDPAVQVYISQSFYFDGQNFWPAYVLPQDLIQPLHILERLGGTQQQFYEMRACDNGLPLLQKTPALLYWEWRSFGSGNGNAIWMPGSNVPRDIFIRYASYLSDALTVGDVQWYQQPLPMLRVADVLGYYVAASFDSSRGGGENAADYLAKGKAALKDYMNSTTQKVRQRINHRRRPSSRVQSRQLWGMW